MGAAPIDPGEVNSPFVAGQDHFPRSGYFERKPEFLGEDVDRAERQDSETGTGRSFVSGNEAVEDLVDRSIAPGGNQRGAAFFNRAPGKFRCGTGFRRLEQLRAAAKARQPLSEHLRTVSVGGGIEDDANHRTCECEGKPADWAGPASDQDFGTMM